MWDPPDTEDEQEQDEQDSSGGQDDSGQDERQEGGHDGSPDEGSEVPPAPSLDSEYDEQEREYIEAQERISQRAHPVGRFVDGLRKRDAMGLMVPPPERGAGRQIRGTIDTHTGLFIGTLVASHRWPWRNEGDFVRSAVAYLIKEKRLAEGSDYAGYFRDQWEMTRRAQLRKRVLDAAEMAREIEGAVRAYVHVGKVAEAADYLRAEIAVLKAKGEVDGFYGLVLSVLEKTFTREGGPALLQVWRLV